MATVSRSASKIAWSPKKQSAFGTPLVKTDLTSHMKLSEPLIIKEQPEHWSDKGSIGAGHDFETQRGISRQWLTCDLVSQPLPVDFVAYLLALFFGNVTDAEVQVGKVYSHTSILDTLDNVPDAEVFTLAALEDGVDQVLQDLAIKSLTISGEGSDRMQAGGSFIGSKIGTPLDTYTWPSSAALRYLYHYAGIFTLDGGDKKSQLRSFELSMESGINEELAWQKVAAEADRIYPSVWRYTPERSMGLKVSILAESGDLATYRAAWQAGTEIAVILSCLGEEISGSDPADYDELSISIPAAVITEFDYSFNNGLMQIDMTLEGHYDSGISSIIQTVVIEGSVADIWP